MISIITGSIILSLLHAAIPNHWLPVVVIGRREKWSASEVQKVTFYAASAHGLSTVLIGVIFSIIGDTLSGYIGSFTHWIAPAILILLGIFFIFRHHYHRHFPLRIQEKERNSKIRIILALTFAMFLSPCMEIEGYFLLAGGINWWLVGLVAIIYVILSVSGMIILANLAYRQVLRMNWHSLEQNAGFFAGITLIATGILAFFIE